MKKVYQEILMQFSVDDDVDIESQWFTIKKINKIKQVHDYLDSLPEIGKVLSLASTIRVAEKLNENKVNITVLPYPNTHNDWWAKFKSFENIFVIGSISENYIGVPQALILGKQNFEYADKNIVLSLLEIQSKDQKTCSSLLLLEDYSIVAEKNIGNGKSVIIFATKAISREEIDGKIKSIKKNKFNLQDSPEIMGLYAVYK